MLFFMYMAKKVLWDRIDIGIPNTAQWDDAQALSRIQGYSMFLDEAIGAERFPESIVIRCIPCAANFIPIRECNCTTQLLLRIPYRTVHRLLPPMRFRK